MRDDDALHPAVQKAQDRRVLVVGNTGNRGDAEHLGRPHHVLDFVQAHRAVLAIDHHEVVADRSEQLDQIRRVAADDGAEHHLALGQFCLCRIGTHGSPVLRLPFVRFDVRRARALDQ